MRKTIEIQVKNKTATLVHRDDYAVCGNSDFVLSFSFDSEWSNLNTKTVRFRYNEQYVDIAIVGTQCSMPVIQNAEWVEIGVFAGNLCTTTPVRLPMRRSILCRGGVPASPSTSVYNQIMTMLEGFTASVSKSGRKSTVTLTYPNGEKTVEVYDGQDGTDGTNGTDGADGQNGVGIASVAYKNQDAQGENVYTVTMTDGSSYEFTAPKGGPGTQGPKGDKGDTGETGAQGAKGDKGDTGETGARGPQGETGAQGAKGDKGDTGAQGPQGIAGTTPVKGVDYFTDGEKAAIVADVIAALPIYDGAVV